MIASAGPWSGSTVYAELKKRTPATAGLPDVMVNAAPPADRLTSIGTKVPGVGSAPTESTSAGSAPPAAGTLAGPTRVSAKRGRVSVTTIVSGS